MKKYINLLLITALITVSISNTYSQSPEWNLLRNLPEQISGHGAIAIDNQIFVAGGCTSPTGPAVKNAFVYDLKSNEWTATPNLTKARSKFGMVSDGSRILALGGEPYLFYAEGFNPGTDSWYDLPRMITGRQEFACASVNGNVYVISGKIGEGILTNKTEMFDTELNKWISKSSIPTPRHCAAAVTYKGKIYVFGGFSNKQNQFVAKIEVYDPATNSWSSKSDMPIPTANFGIAVLNNLIFVVGGEGDAAGIIQMYSPDTDSWLKTTLGLPTRKKCMGVCSIDEKLYIIGGVDASGTPTNSVEVYNPSLAEVIDKSADSNGDALKVFLNGNSLKVTFKSKSSGSAVIALYDYSGNLVNLLGNATISDGGFEYEDVLNVQPGVYFCTVSLSGKIYSHKIVFN